MNARHHIIDLDAVIADYDPADPPVERVRVAQALIKAAIGILYQVTKEKKDSYSRVYIVDQITVLAGTGHGFIDGGANLDEWIAQLKEGAEGDDEESTP